MAVVTSIAVLISVSISFEINATKGEILQLADWLVPSFLSPLIITPFVAFVLLTMLRRMNRLGAELADSLERERLLALEMRHRLKNLYSVTGGLISLAEREVSDEDRASLPKILRAKLAALARASDATFTSSLAGSTPHGSLDLGKIVRAVMAPYESQVCISGPATTISAQAMTTVALILHELATNSVNYGALCAEAGSVRISWERARHTVHLNWLESGGPTIRNTPSRSGFGTAVIDRFIQGVGGTISKDWLPTGLSVEITLPDGQ